jgi:hypothetical protein
MKHLLDRLLLDRAAGCILVICHQSIIDLDGRAHQRSILRQTCIGP